MDSLFVRLKHFKGRATHYDKLKQNYENSVALSLSLLGYYYEMSTAPIFFKIKVIRQFTIR